MLQHVIVSRGTHPLSTQFQKTFETVHPTSSTPGSTQNWYSVLLDTRNPERAQIATDMVNLILDEVRRLGVTKQLQKKYFANM